ncbi:V-set and immunoglobulin domain-containing protein 2, partial [Ophiophagus hannah]
MQQKGSNVEIPCHYKTSVGKSFVLEWRFASGSTAPDAGTQVKREQGQFARKTEGEEMPPSTPVCKGSTTGHIGSDVTFSCSSSEGVPTPIYSWTLLDSKQPLPTSNMVQNISYDVAPDHVIGDNHFKEMGLEAPGVSKAGAVAGALIGAILALFLLGAIVLYILRYRRNRMAKKKPQSEYSGNEISRCVVVAPVKNIDISRSVGRRMPQLLESSTPWREGTVNQKANSWKMSLLDLDQQVQPNPT